MAMETFHEQQSVAMLLVPLGPSCALGRAILNLGNPIASFLLNKTSNAAAHEPIMWLACRSVHAAAGGCPGVPQHRVH